VEIIVYNTKGFYHIEYLIYDVYNVRFVILFSESAFPGTFSPQFWLLQSANESTQVFMESVAGLIQ